MGLLIQNSENCFIDNLVVTPSSRRASASDDALHITDCRGKIKVINCKLKGTLDDSINIHGVFRKLKSRIPGGKMYYLEAGHFRDHYQLHNLPEALHPVDYDVRRAHFEALRQEDQGSEAR